VRFSSQLPIVNVGIEAPAYYTVANDSMGRLQPQRMLVTIRLDTPVNSPTQFTPSMLLLRGAALTGNTTATQWSYTNNGEEFVATILPAATSDFQDVVIQVTNNAIGFIQGNFFARRTVSYEPGTSNAQRPNATL